MKRILVLGERKSSLQRLIDLRSSRPSWEGAAVSDPKDAERALSNDRFDALAAVHAATRMAHDPSDTCDEYLTSLGVGAWNPCT